MDHYKLVRDGIPEIIRNAAMEPLIRVAGDEEYGDLLRAKLVEEVDEFLASASDVNELADILEVLLALANHLGIDRARLEELRRNKELERGRFAGRIVWSGNAQG